jgi:lipopolysaccharide cholinephosphotransferase
MELIDYADGKPSPALLRLQQVHRSMLADLLAFADDLDVRCFLVAGSALGAVRHGDAIPWDDDLDVGMLRPEYERLIASWSPVRMPGYYLQTEWNDDRYRLAFTKLRKDNTCYADTYAEELGTHPGIFIDIFPFDPIGPYEFINKAKAWLIFALDLVLLSNSSQLRAFSTHASVRAIRGVFGRLDRFLPVRLLKRLRAWIMTSSARRGNKRLCCFGMYGPLRYRKTLTTADELFPLVSVPFGDATAPLPNKAGDILTRIFGDYMRLPDPAHRKPFHTSEVSFGD